tara:strand:+ start:3458 stop:4924 length:1467 start_codon:yes stop_codon:yes gene_type:complete
MVRKRNIIIVSARRSGTHLLVDLITNNFDYESLNYNYLDYLKFTDEMPKLESAFNKGGIVTWTHSHNYKDYHKLKHSKRDEKKLDKFFKESKILLVYRDIRDIINSCFHRPRYKKKYDSFLDFYKNFNYDGYELIDQNYENIFELLLQYYKNWFSVYMSKELLDLDMEVISFENIINNYEKSVNKISSFLEIPMKKLVDVRLPNENKSLKFTTNDFRAGKVGDWINTFPFKLGKELGERYNRDLGAGVNCFLDDIKIHKYHSPLRSKFQNKFNWKKEEIKIDIPFYKPEIDIERRYNEAEKTSSDFRYYHKVFYYKKYVLKFHYPCKASLSKSTFNHAVPIASKQQLLTIIKTNKFLYENGIVPKLYYANIYKGVLFVVQEKLPEENILYNKYNFFPEWGDFKWVHDLGISSTLKEYFYIALEKNILLTDLINISNCAYDEKGNLKYFDLDGIKYFDTNEKMIQSEDYKNSTGIIKEIERFENVHNYN